LVTKNATSSTASNDFGSRSKKLETKEEEVKEKTKGANSKKNPRPLHGRVAATGTKDLVPSGVSDILGIFIKEVYITDVSRSGWAFLTALVSIHVAGVVAKG
jgi:hypothetical protein